MPLSGPLRTLERLAIFHENTARVIRAAMRLYTEHHSIARRDEARLASVLDTLDRARQASTRAASEPGYGTRQRERERRRASAALLATFDPVVPRDAPAGRERSVAPLIRHGYLRKKGEGYVRTSKPFTRAD